MRKLKEQKGITLVALVITIVVMLILVGVTISVSLKGGLFSTAKQATKETQIAQEKEELLTAALGALNKNGEVDLSKLDGSLPEGFTGSNGQYTSKTGNVFTVTEDGTITLVGEGSVEQPETPPADAAIALSATVITKEITSGTAETVELTAELYNASGDLTWTSSDTSVAEISGSGTTRTITLKKAGTAIITVSYGEVRATCNITVTEKQATMISFTINGTSYSVEEGTTWEKWIDSGDAPSDLKVYGGLVTMGDPLSGPSGFVNSTDQIISGESYYRSMP